MTTAHLHRAPHGRLYAALLSRVPTYALTRAGRRAFALAAVLVTLAALVGCIPADATTPGLDGPVPSPSPQAPPVPPGGQP